LNVFRNKPIAWHVPHSLSESATIWI